MQNEGWNQFIKDCASHYRYKTKEEVQALISSWRDMLKNAQNDDEIEEKELTYLIWKYTNLGLPDWRNDGKKE